MYLLDSTIIIDYLRGRPDTVELLKDLHARSFSLGCCPINIIEVCAGMREKEEQATLGFLESLEFYPLSSETAVLAGDYMRRYRGKGITLSLSDASIASVAVLNGLTLLTDNAKHYPQPELKIQEA
jgi:predicted nucleic acid-binding protein